MNLTELERTSLLIAKVVLRSGQPFDQALADVLIRALIREEATARSLQDQTQVCVCVADHRPPPLELNDHHIVPQALGGETRPENLVHLCPTTHASVHVIWRHLLKYGRLSRAEVQTAVGIRTVSGYAYKIAITGFEGWLADTGVRP